MSLVNKFQEIQAGKAFLKAIEEAYATSKKPGARFKPQPATPVTQQHLKYVDAQKTPVQGQQAQQQGQQTQQQPQQDQQQAQAGQQQQPQQGQQQQPQQAQNFDQQILQLAKDKMNREQILGILRAELKRRGA